MKPYPYLMITGLCVLSICCSAMDTAGADLDRGYQILLGRGLQIQAQAFTDFGFNANRWLSAKFTTINFQWSSHPEVLSQLPAGATWGRWTGSGLKYLTSAEAPYASNFVSFQYSDEPTLDSGTLSDMTTTYASWHNLHPNALAYTSFYGSQLEADALAAYQQATYPDMVMFDSYPRFSYPLTDRNGCYQRMQEYRLAGLAGNDGSGNHPIPYGQYVNLYRNSYSDSLPSESFVRRQQFASWAFGYTFISGFVYNQANSETVPVMFSSPGDSSPTPVFNYVAESNRQSRNLSPALVRMLSTDVRIIPGMVDGTGIMLPPGLSNWASGAGGSPYITGITPRGKNNIANPWNYSDVVVGYFKPLLANNPGYTFVDGTHFMIINGNTGAPFAPGAAGDPASASAEWYRIDFDFGASGFNSLVRLSRDTGSVELVTLQHLSGGDGALYRLDLQLDGGTGDLFGFWNSSNPLPTIPEPGSGTLALLGTGLIGAYAYPRRRRR